MFKNFFVKTAALGATITILASCSSTKMVRVVVDPPEATILLNDKEVGTGSYEKIMDFGKSPSYTFTGKLDRFTEGKVEVKYEPKTTTEYKIELQRMYSLDIPLTDFEAIRERTGMKFGYNTKQVRAYYNILEPSKAIKGLIQVTDNKNGSLQYGGPVLSPTENYFMYRVLKQEDGKQSSQIWKQDIGAKGTTRFIAEKALAMMPAIDPSGKNVFFSSNRISGIYKLWRRAFAGGGTTLITGGGSQCFSSSMSPNGSQIAYTCHPEDSDTLQVWTINEDGRLPTQLCQGFDPQVSPDGKKIMFLRKTNGKGNPQLWIMDFGSGNETQMTTNEDYSIKDPRWSPDGSVIVFASNEGKDNKGRNNYDIWMMNADGSSKTQLTMNGSHDDKPCFDRHGEQVYFRSNRGTHWNIWSFKLSDRFSKKRRAFEMGK